MPVLGGAAVLLSFWLTVALAICVAVIAKTRFPTPSGFVDLINGALLLLPRIYVLFAGSLIIWFVGLVDDRWNLHPFVKLAGQGAACLVLIGAGITISSLSAWGSAGDAITLIWMLLIINAFNFIDSIDGHCAGVAVTSLVVFFLLLQVVQQPLVGILVITLAGAVLGFLPHNFKPAKIFLGDNGSLLIGYMMAAVTLLASYDSQGSPGISQLIPILMFGVPIYDTVSVVVVRILRGTPPWLGDRNHFAHRLKRLGMSDKVAVTFSIFVTLSLGLIAILSTQIHSFLGEALVLLLFMSFIAIIAFLEYYSAARIQITQDLARQNKRRKDDIRSAEDEIL